MTVLASMVEYVLKPYLMWKKGQDVEAEVIYMTETEKADDTVYGRASKGSSYSFNIMTKAGLLEYIQVTATMELVIFYLEDCTTLLIWYITGTYKTTDEEGDVVVDPASKMNLITTITSASIAATALLVSSVMQAQTKKTCFKSGATRNQKIFHMSKLILNYATIAFWLFVAVNINKGGKAIAESRLSCYDGEIVELGLLVCPEQTVTEDKCYNAMKELLPNIPDGQGARLKNKDLPVLGRNNEALLKPNGQFYAKGDARANQWELCDSTLAKMCAIDGKTVKIDSLNAPYGCSLMEIERDKTIPNSLKKFQPTWNTNVAGEDSETKHRQVCDANLLENEVVVAADSRRSRRTTGREGAGGKNRTASEMKTNRALERVDADNIATRTMLPWNHGDHPHHQMDRMQKQEQTTAECLAERCASEYVACTEDTMCTELLGEVNGYFSGAPGDYYPVGSASAVFFSCFTTKLQDGATSGSACSGKIVASVTTTISPPMMSTAEIPEIESNHRAGTDNVTTLPSSHANHPRLQAGRMRKQEQPAANATIDRAIRGGSGDEQSESGWADPLTFQGKSRPPRPIGSKLLYHEDFEDSGAAARWTGLAPSGMPNTARLVTSKDCKRGKSCLKFSACGPASITGDAFSAQEFKCSYDNPCDVSFWYKGPIAQGFSVDTPGDHTFAASYDGNVGNYPGLIPDLTGQKWKRVRYRFPDQSKENKLKGISEKHAVSGTSSSSATEGSAGGGIILEVRMALQAVPPTAERNPFRGQYDESLCTEAYVDDIIVEQANDHLTKFIYFVYVARKSMHPLSNR